MTRDPCLKRWLAAQFYLRICQHRRAVEEHGILAEGSEQEMEFSEVGRGREEVKGLFQQQAYVLAEERAGDLVGWRPWCQCCQGLSLMAEPQVVVVVEELYLSSSLLLKVRRGQSRWPSPRLVFV